MNGLAWGRGTLASMALMLVLPAVGGAQQQDECRCEVGPRVLLRGDLPAIAHLNLGFPRARIGISLGGENQEQHADVGAYVQEVAEDSPAARAGVRAGDVIVAVDGHRLLQPLDPDIERRLHEDDMLPVERLMALAREWEAGEAVEIAYVRDGRENTVSMEAEESRFGVRLGEVGDRLSELGPRLERQLAPLRGQLGEWDSRDGNRIVWEGSPGAFVYGLGPTAGLELRTLNPDLGSYFGATEGVLVLEVDEDSTLGLRAGDVILTVGDRDVDDPADVRRILRSYDDGETVRFQVMRNGQRVTAEGAVER